MVFASFAKNPAIENSWEELSATGFEPIQPCGYLFDKQLRLPFRHADTKCVLGGWDSDPRWFFSCFSDNPSRSLELVQSGAPARNRTWI